MLQAMQKCPELQCLHVQTLGTCSLQLILCRECKLTTMSQSASGVGVSILLSLPLQLHEDMSRLFSTLKEKSQTHCTGGETGEEGLDGPVNSGSTHPNDRLLHKACLERYSPL